MIPWRNLRRFFYKAIKQPGYAFGVFIKRLKAYCYYRLDRGRSSYPEAVTLFLTHRCNLHCQMCGQWQEGGVTKKQSAQYIQTELSLNDLISIINDLSSFRPNITLFGGEPLLYPDCLKIIKYIKQRGMHCLIISNGSLLKDVAEEIVDNGLDELNVSLDGDAKLHNRIRGMPGLFEKIIEGLKQINYFKLKKNKKKPLINLQCTINKENYQHLEQLIDVANETEATSLTFHNLIFIKQEVLNKQKEYDKLLGCTSSDWEGFMFEPGIEQGLLYEKIKNIMSGNYRFSVDFYPNFSHKSLMQYYQNPAYYIPSGYPCRCLSPWMVAYIFPDGKVKPCLNSTYFYGNIKNNNFREIWNSKEAITFRRLLKKKQIFPVCVRCTELYRY
jgi:radical SAM protein with 4Fe4S-binding SPASM domain